MSGLICAPLLEGHLEAGAALVLERYSRRAAPGLALPSTELTSDQVVSRLRSLPGRSPALTGAFEGGWLAGFLGGFELSGRDRAWMFVPDWGWAAEGREVLEALYTSAATEWVAEGQRTHFWRVFSHEASTLEALAWLGFGMTGVDAIRPAEPLDGPASTTISVRRAGPEDVGVAAAFEHGLREHLAGAPVFFPLRPPLSEEEHVRVLADRETASLVAERAGEPLGWLRIGPASDQAPLQLPCLALASISRAFTTPGSRRSGVATALLAAAIEWAREAGYSHVHVDFESANVLARRFWLRHFSPVSYTLCRQVEEPGAAP